MRKSYLLLVTGLLITVTLAGCRKLRPDEIEAIKEGKTISPYGSSTEEGADASGSGADVTELSSDEIDALNADSVPMKLAGEATGLDSRDTVMARVEADGTDTPVGTTTSSPKGSGEVIVYNWGEYIDPDVLTEFTEETGIRVVYDEFETNEIMYPKIAAGGVAYDVICPSDYMVDRMIREGLLQPIDYDRVPNVANLDPAYLLSAQEFDPGNLYCVPYCWGTVGILYNRTMVDPSDDVTSWNILWNEKYKDSILMQDSVRDALMVALKKNGFSLNTDSEEELSKAADDLIEQKPLVQAYVIDQVRDKMIGGEAALGVIYSGEAIYTQRENPDLDYVIPKEGSNVWIDGWVIPRNAPNKENAEAFINYLCRADVALKNFEYITYSTPNRAARALIEDEDIRDSTIAFPTEEMLKDCETMKYLGDDLNDLYTEYWNKVKSS